MLSNVLPASMTVPNFTGQGRIAFTQKQVPVPEPGQLLIQVKANAVCGSERNQFLNGSSVTPGHEMAGMVVATGSGVDVPLGTHGVVFLMDYCGTCRNCLHGFTNQCLQKRGDMGFNRDGGYGPYAVVHETIFFPVDSDISLAEATLLLDVMGTTSHAITRAQLVHPDIQSILIMGAGPVGLGALAMTKIMLGKDTPIIISDVLSYRLQLAEQLGGLPLNVQQLSLKAGLPQHNFHEVDLVIDTSGKGSARQEGIDILARRGVLVCIGHGENLHLTISPQLIAPERAVLGSEYFCYNELPENLERLRSHRDYLRSIITHRFMVNDVQPAFELFFSGNTGKVIVEQ